MQVRFLNLSLEKEQRTVLLSAIDRVLAHGMLVNGPEVSRFESEAAAFCGRRFAVGTGSGSDALYLALRAHGIGEGDEVLTTSFSWIATANAIALTGAEPVFADIKDDLNIDAESVKRLITDKTKAILPVHYTGRIADMKEINEIAENNGLLVIEDASQSFGAEKYGRKAGSFGHCACFSFNPMKVLGAIGEAGMCLTDRDEIRQRLESLRYNGTVNKEICNEPGLNARLDTIQAAVLSERLINVHKVISTRRKNADFYFHALNDINGLFLPYEAPGEKNVYYTFTVQTEKRDALSAFLTEKGIENKIYHPFLMPLQPAYINRCRSEHSNAEKCLGRILCIPVHEKLTYQELEYTAKSIKEFFRQV